MLSYRKIVQSLFPETLSHEDVAKFITFPDEQLILAAREHSGLLLFRLAQVSAGEMLASIGAAVAAYFLSRDIILSIAVLLTLGLVSSGLLIREMVHWYFHVYIVTTKKILEVRYNPLFSELSSSVLLDQLRCTEIDAEMRGFVSELIDLGNVEITFDRPTHQEEFILRNIRSPRKIANHLSAHLHGNKQELDGNHEVWFKNVHTNKYQFIEPITYGGVN